MYCGQVRKKERDWLLIILKSKFLAISSENKLFAPQGWHLASFRVSVDQDICLDADTLFMVSLHPWRPMTSERGLMVLRES